MRLNWKRKGRIVLPVLGDKNLEKNLRENDKKFVFESGSVEERENNFLKTFEIVKNTWKAHVLKNSLTDFWSVEK